MLYKQVTLVSFRCKTFAHEIGENILFFAYNTSNNAGEVLTFGQKYLFFIFTNIET